MIVGRVVAAHDRSSRSPGENGGRREVSSIREAGLLQRIPLMMMMFHMKQGRGPQSPATSFADDRRRFGSPGP
jgi:hypothetical protein